MSAISIAIHHLPTSGESPPIYSPLSSAELQRGDNLIVSLSIFYIHEKTHKHQPIAHRTCNILMYFCQWRRIFIEFTCKLYRTYDRVLRLDSTLRIQSHFMRPMSVYASNQKLKSGVNPSSFLNFLNWRALIDNRDVCLMNVGTQQQFELSIFLF